MKIRNFIKSVVLQRYPPYPYRAYNDAIHSIFIHIPKTAGSSLLKAIGAPERGRLHIDYAHFERSDPLRFNKYFKFAVIRDPVDRAFSCYNYLVSGGNKSKEDQALRDLIATECSGFDGFVQDFMSPSIVSTWNMLRPQTAYVCSRSGKVMVDLLLRYESLDYDYQNLKMNIPNLPSRLPKINIGSRPKLVSATQTSINLLRSYYQSDFDNFYA